MSVKSVNIYTIPHDRQRYPTTGDWIYNAGGESLLIYVSDMDDWRLNMLVAIHEYTEALLCIERGISQKSIDEFDQKYEAIRDHYYGPKTPLPESFVPTGIAERITEHSEPGDDPDAPYHNEHCFATSVERMLCATLGVNWYDYEIANEQLYGR